MTTKLRFALFVEGGAEPPRARTEWPLQVLWNQTLCGALHLPPFDLIVPISKTHLLAMDPSNPPMSGSQEGLDQLIARKLASHPFDVAVVAWDLFPDWNETGEYCRWEETLSLYRCLSLSSAMPPDWIEKAQARYEALTRRRAPGERPGPVRPEAGMVLPLCMEPMFEVLLAQDEGGVKRALGLTHRRIDGWPARGWNDPQERRPDTRVIAPAIAALFRLQPKPQVLRRIRGDMKTNKDGWGEYLLRNLLGDERSRGIILGHPIARRLAEIVPTRRDTTPATSRS